jgi:hypothetical protein
VARDDDALGRSGRSAELRVEPAQLQRARRARPVDEAARRAREAVGGTPARVGVVGGQDGLRLHAQGVARFPPED